MVYQIIYIVESLFVVNCFHCVYGEKIRVNWKFWMLLLSLLLLMNIANRPSLGVECTVLIYIVLEVYCIYTFRRKMKANIINFVLTIIMVAVIELVCGLLLAFILRDNVLQKTLCAGVLALAISTIVLQRMELHRISMWALRKNLIFYLALAYVGIFTFNMIAQFKIFGWLLNMNYIWGIPFTIFILLLAGQWAKYQKFYEEKEKELQVYVKDKKAYQGFVTKIRMRQHEINNHITAILAMHYTKPTYKELVKAQKEYCHHIIAENKYNVLLKLSDSILIGFLYDKFNDIEKQGIFIDCHITVKTYQPVAPEYYLIEMLGILLNNATEALADSGFPQVIHIEIIENENGYKHIVRNPYHYVTCSEIESWFEFEKSSKGEGRGVGLYHLRCLCQEWNCYVGCNAVEIDNVNWIEFGIETGRKV